MSECKFYVLINKKSNLEKDFSYKFSQLVNYLGSVSIAFEGEENSVHPLLL